ncbi:MAG: nucleoside triphosphate pyrophosphohydrolase [Myxococcales bacterium]|nr:nucleoside triphosphate pyrophosphohydrolase [Myxococcales bacterium]
MSETAARFDRLVEIMDQLRDPGGCPWDAEQTMESLQPYLIEEAYECLEAMERGDRKAQCDELGDLLLQVVFQSRIAKEERAFTLDEVIDGICDKLIRRHPHVFEDNRSLDAGAVEQQWEQIKRAEKKGKQRSIVAGIPPAAPALQRAARLGEKAARVGLDWEDVAGVRSKVLEELDELEAARQSGHQGDLEGEFGDLLFSLAQWARHMDLEPEAALRRATRKFTDRVQAIEGILAQRNETWERVTDLDALWNEAKGLSQVAPKG